MSPPPFAPISPLPPPPPIDLNSSELSFFFNLLNVNGNHRNANHDLNGINSFFGKSYNTINNRDTYKHNLFSGNTKGLNFNSHGDEYPYGQNFGGNKTNYHEILDFGNINNNNSNSFGGGASTNGSTLGRGISFGSFGTRAY